MCNDLCMLFIYGARRNDFDAGKSMKRDIGRSVPWISSLFAWALQWKSAKRFSGWSWKFFLANFQILGPLGCQGWVVIPQNVKKSKNHCTSNDPNNGFSPSQQIKKSRHYVKNRYIGNFMYMSFARCHFRAPKKSVFSGPLSSIGPCNGFVCPLQGGGRSGTKCI